LTGDADILKTLAQTLDLAQTLKEHELCPDELRAILQKAATALSGSEEPAAGERLFTIYADGAARRNPGPAGAGFAIYCDGRMIEGQAQYLGELTNNQAEYNALILALDRAQELGAHKVLARLDSELVVKQMRGEYQVKNRELRGLLQRALELSRRFPNFEIQHIPRDLNREADRLANRAIDEFEGDEEP